MFIVKVSLQLTDQQFIGGNIMKKWEAPQVKKLDIRETERPGKGKGHGYGRTKSKWGKFF